MIIPNYLYKYEKINEQTLRRLKNAQIFFNTPSSFNDPFDCSVLEASVLLKPDDYTYFCKRFLKEKGIDSDADIKVSDIPEKCINQINNVIQKKLEEKQYHWLHEIGCTCFSENKDHILMWSHYADGHKGFCLEFNTSFDPFQKARKVDYSYNFPSIDPKRLVGENQASGDGILSPLFTKYKCWNYENEWRIFHREPNKPYGYEVDALNAVYFGSAADDTDIEIVCLLLQGQSKKIKFYKARKNISTYSLHFDEFLYKPYIEHNKANQPTQKAARLISGV